jgi:uncharacterized protein (TIGR02145 family)
MKPLLLFLFVSTATRLLSQTIENVDFRAVGKTIVVSYDFLKRKDTTINIEVYFKSDKGEVITPKYLSGDLRNVHPGISKQIIWEILKEGFYLSGRFLVEIKEKRAYRTTILGNQRWYAENLYTSKFRNGDEIPEAKTAEQWKQSILKRQPAWCYFNNDPSTEATYGKLYNSFALNDPRNITPEGWFVPTVAEWDQVYSLYADMNIALNKLKSTKGWSPSMAKNSNGTNESGFSAYPNGYRNENGEFINTEGKTASFWCFDNDGSGNLRVHCIKGNPQEPRSVIEDMGDAGEGHPIRLFSNEMTFTEVYMMGNVWMKENLNLFRFRNGDIIPEAKTAAEWKNAAERGTPAWCYYNNDSKNSAFGKLYNWYAVNDKRGLAPKGWHVPSSEEWKSVKMVTYVNPSGHLQTVEQANEMDKINGNHLKSQTGWEPIYDPYRGKLDGNGQDTKGFSALPGGSRLPKEYDNYDYNDLLFQGIGWLGAWWTSSEKNNNEVYIYIINGKLGLKLWSASKGWGYSVRCVKNK